MNIIRVLSFLLAIAGVLLTSLSDISGADFKQSQYLTGNLIFLFACCCCGFYNTYCKMLVDKKLTELEILVYSSLIGCIASIPLLIWAEPFHYSAFMHSGKVALFGILELSVIVYGISMLLFFYILKRMDVTQAVLGTYLLPFFIALLGIFLLNEKITSLMLIGGLLILVSTIMVTIYENALLAFFKKSKPFTGDKPLSETTKIN
jgi:drug/metabolite transporter (DMT)-like permease